jgi:hypothetical protein
MLELVGEKIFQIIIIIIYYIIISKMIRYMNKVIREDLGKI